jgi:short-subunit dehydrogenase
MSAEDIRQTIDTNLVAPLLLARQILPGMIRRNQGAIVNLASLAGHIALPTLSAYAASKAGLIPWTEAMASELEGSEVKVAAVCPTFVSGEGMHARTGVKAPWIAGEVTPEKVARAVVKAINGRTHEFIVTPMPTRPLLAPQALSPGLVRRLKRTLGLVAYVARRTGK